MDNVEKQSPELSQALPDGVAENSPEQAKSLPVGESFIVANHNDRLETFGIDNATMMSAKVLAEDRADFHVAQIVSGNDWTEAGKALVSELMQYEHYRRAFSESVPNFYDDALDKFKPDLDAGMAVANELIKDAESRFGPLPPTDQPTKMELKEWRVLYGDRISLEELPEYMLPGGPSIVGATDAKFGDLGILSEEGFELAFDRAVIQVHRLEQANAAQASAPAPATVPATAPKKPRAPRTAPAPAPASATAPAAAPKKPRAPRTPKPPAEIDGAAIESNRPQSKKAKPQTPKEKQPSAKPATGPDVTTASTSVSTTAAEVSAQSGNQSAVAETAAQPTVNASGAVSPATAEATPVIKVLPGEPGSELTPYERNQLRALGWTDDRLSNVDPDQARVALADPSTTPLSAAASATQLEPAENLVPEPHSVAEPKATVEEASDSLPIEDPVIVPRQANAGTNEAATEPLSEIDTIWCGPRRGVDEPQPESAKIDKDALLSRLDSKVQDDKSVLYTLDGEPAFVDRGMRLEMADGASQSDEKVLAALLTAAEFYRGRIELTGSEAFQRKAIGLIAQYQPNVTMKKPDQQMMLVEARKALQAEPVVKDAIHGESPPAPGDAGPAPNSSSAVAQPTAVPPEQLQPAPTTGGAQADAGQPSMGATAAAQTNALPDPVASPSAGAGFTKTRPSDIHESHQSAAKGVVGKVMGSGNAPFQFDEKNTESTYITLRTKAGVQTYWGKELAGLLRDTRVTPGKMVTLQWLGKEPVTVKVPVKDEHGIVKKYEDKPTHRNKWSLAVMGAPAVQTGQDEGVKMVAYDANRFAEVQRTVLTRLRLDVPLPATPNDGLYWMTPDGQGSFKSGDPLTAPRPPADNAVAGHPVMSSYSSDGSLEMALFRSDGPFLQGVVRQNGHYQHVLVSLPNRDDAPPMVFNALTPTCLAPIGVGNGINKSGGQPVSRENIAFRLDGDSNTRIGKLDKPAEVPPQLHARLGFDERWRDDNTLPKSAPAAAPTVQPSEPRPA